jgi:Flp pilus assembly protein TadD
MAFAMASILGACSGLRLSEDAPRELTLGVADAALVSGAPELAQRVADLVLAKQPDNALALIVRGDALYALGRRDMAQMAYRAAIAIDPTAARAQVGLGRTLAQSDPHAAEAAFLSALAKEPDNVVALNNLGVVRDLQGHNVEAQEAYDHALTVAPGSVDVQINLGMSLALSGRRAEAAQLLHGVAAVPGATQAWRKELLAGLTLAGDGPWSQQMAQANPVQAPQDPAFAGETVHLASAAAPLPLVSKVDGRASVGEPSAAPLANGRSPASGARTSHATRSIPEALVAEAPASIQIPVADPAPRSPVIATDLPSIGSVPDVVPPMAIRPIVTISSKLANASPSQPDATTTGIDTDVATPAPSMPEVGMQIAVLQPKAPMAAVTRDVSTVKGAPYVQVGSLISETDAIFEWRRLNKRFSQFLLGREPTITRAKVRGQTYWRLRTFGFASFAEANELCSRLKAARLGCWSGRDL